MIPNVMVWYIKNDAIEYIPRINYWFMQPWTSLFKGLRGLYGPNPLHLNLWRCIYLKSIIILNEFFESPDVFKEIDMFVASLLDTFAGI